MFKKTHLRIIFELVTVITEYKMESRTGLNIRGLFFNLIYGICVCLRVNPSPKFKLNLPSR